MCDTDFDPCAIFDVTTPTARKPHKCGECRLQVKPGRKHVRVGSLFDGHWETYRAHAECYALMGFIEKEVCGGHGSILLHGLAEEIWNLNEYTVTRADEHDDLRAMGFDPEKDGVRQVCQWLWDCIKAEYRA